MLVNYNYDGKYLTIYDSDFTEIVIATNFFIVEVAKVYYNKQLNVAKAIAEFYLLLDFSDYNFNCSIKQDCEYFKSRLPSVNFEKLIPCIKRHYKRIRQ